MLIVLKGADFSANKIGTVVVPRDSLDSTTQSILDNYTKVLSTSVKYSFDDLIIALKANGIWSKIVFAYFPFLANSVEEALYEAKGGIALSGVVNAGSIVTTGYQLENYGLKTRGWVSGDGYDIVMPQYTYGVNTNSFFIASLFRKDSTTSLYVGSLGNKAYIKTDETAFMMGSDLSSIRKISTGANPNVGSYNVLIGNARNPGNAENYIDILSNGVSTYNYQTLGTAYSNPNSVEKQPFIATTGYSQWHYNTWPVAVQLFGNELTSNEMVTLNTLLQDFNAKLIS